MTDQTPVPPPSPSPRPLRDEEYVDRMAALIWEGAPRLVNIFRYPWSETLPSGSERQFFLELAKGVVAKLETREKAQFDKIPRRIVAGSEPGSQTAELTWDSVEGASRYRVSVRNRDKPWLDDAGPFDVSEPRFAWTAPEPGWYVFNVSSVDRDGKESRSNSGFADLSLLRLGVTRDGRTFLLSWNSVEGARSYRVSWEAEKTGVVCSFPASEERSWVVTLDAEKEYAFKAMAIGTSDRTIAESFVVYGNTYSWSK